MTFIVPYKGPFGYTIFDIEFSLEQDTHDKHRWYSEIHVLPRVEGIVRFVMDKKNDENFNYEDFISQAYKIEELREWLYSSSTGHNFANESKIATELHYKHRYPYIKELLQNFCKEYGLDLKED